MKHLFVLFTFIFSLIGTSFDAEARKKFGSKSKGKTHKTETVQKKQQVDLKNPSLPAKNPAKKSSKKGIMAGVLGGLLAGGLIASMMGDDFEGFQIFEMIMLALAAFLIFKLIKAFMSKNRAQPAMATQGAPFAQSPQTQPHFQQRESTTSFTQTSEEQVPFNLPANFDMNAFLQGAREHYSSLQKAWNENDFSQIQEYVSPELYNELKAERAEAGDVQTEVMFVDAQIVRAQTLPQVWELSVKFSGKYRDLGDKQEEPILEVWHLERRTNQDNAPWLIVGIEDQV